MKNVKPSILLNKEILKIQDTFEEINSSNLTNFNKLCELSVKQIKKGNKIIFFGNGGSASDAQHLATEIVVRYQKNRKALPAISLATDTSILTAIGNDFGFEKIFSRQIEALGNKGDIAIAITTSGNSKNLIQACLMAKKRGLFTFCFSGNKGGKLKKFVHSPIIIPSKQTSVVQVCEIAIGQVLCEYIEKSF